MSAGLEAARVWVGRAQRVVALTGAGISTDSGIPDYRGPQGVWTRDPQAEKMATLEHYVSDPAVRERAWRKRVESRLGERQPNAGHRALAEFERTGRLALLVTQNVDRLHHRAGSSPERIVEVHGNALEVVCLECDERAPMERALARVRAGELDPPCRSCGGILKSATISFGQSLVAEDLERALRGAAECDLLLAVGSTLAVYPVAGMVPVAKEAGARVVIVNGDPTEMDAIADAVLRGKIADVLPALLDPAGGEDA